MKQKIHSFLDLIVYIKNRSIDFKAIKRGPSALEVVYLMLVFLSIGVGCTPLEPNQIMAESQLEWKEGETSIHTFFTWSNDAFSLHNEAPLLTFYFTSPDNQKLTPQDHQWTLVIENQTLNLDSASSQELIRSHTEFSSHLQSEMRVDDAGERLGDGLLGYLTLPLCQSIYTSSSVRSIPQKCLPCPSITQATCQQDGVCQCEMKWTLIRKNGPFPPLNTRLKMNINQRTSTEASFSFSP